MAAALLLICNDAFVRREKAMQVFVKRVMQYCADEDGATAVEYVVIAAAMTLALVPGFYWVSDALQVKFNFIIDFILGTTS